MKNRWIKIPLGLVVFAWDDRIGAELKAKIPENLEFDELNLKQIYSAHFLEEIGGFLSLTIGTLNLSSYYTGPELNHFVSLILNIEEDPDEFEDILTDATRTIIQNLEEDSYVDLLPKIFRMGL